MRASAIKPTSALGPQCSFAVFSFISEVKVSYKGRYKNCTDTSKLTIMNILVTLLEPPVN